jgi:hypothetical protein
MPSHSSAVKTPGPQCPGPQCRGPSTFLAITKETPENKEGDPNAPTVEGDIQNKYLLLLVVQGKYRSSNKTLPKGTQVDIDTVG